MKLSRLLLSLLFFILASGCSTIDSRIREKNASFTSLPSDQQQAIREGRVDVGFSEDMAYMALGRADETRKRQTAEGTSLVWIYLSRTEVYDGPRHAGYVRRVWVDPHTGRYVVRMLPITLDTYRERVEEVLRLEFRDGKVVAIEKADGN